MSCVQKVFESEKAKTSIFHGFEALRKYEKLKNKLIIGAYWKVIL